MKACVARHIWLHTHHGNAGAVCLFDCPIGSPVPEEVPLDLDTGWQKDRSHGGYRILIVFGVHRGEWARGGMQCWPKTLPLAGPRTGDWPPLLGVPWDVFALSGHRPPTPSLAQPIYPASGPGTVQGHACINSALEQQKAHVSQQPIICG